MSLNKGTRENVGFAVGILGLAIGVFSIAADILKDYLGLTYVGLFGAIMSWSSIWLPFLMLGAGYLLGRRARIKQLTAERVVELERQIEELKPFADAAEKERLDRESAERIAAIQAAEETKREQIRLDYEHNKLKQKERENENARKKRKELNLNEDEAYFREELTGTCKALIAALYSKSKHELLVSSLSTFALDRIESGSRSTWRPCFITEDLGEGVVRLKLESWLLNLISNRPEILSGFPSESIKKANKALNEWSSKTINMIFEE